MMSRRDLLTSLAALIAPLPFWLGKAVTDPAGLGCGVADTLADDAVLKADHAVVTLPIGVRQPGKPRFAAPLTRDRQGTIYGLGMGLFNKRSLELGVRGLSAAVTTVSAHQLLRAMVRAGFPAPIAGQITRWSSDHSALGSYFFSAVGTRARTRQALRRVVSDGRLIFAGEAASPGHPGTVRGALMSGSYAGTLVGRA